jgi:hypothetical protein
MAEGVLGRSRGFRQVLGRGQDRLLRGSMAKPGDITKVHEAGIVLVWENGLGGGRAIGEVEPARDAIIVDLAATWGAAPGRSGGLRCVVWRERAAILVIAPTSI